MLFTVLVLSVIGGFFAGLLGVGGAVLLIPLMLAVPPAFGVGALTMGEVAGLTMLQVLAASVAGVVSHRRGGFAHGAVILSLGIPMGVMAFVGAAVSKSMRDETMLIVFGCLVAVAFVMLLRPAVDESHAPGAFAFRRRLGVLCGSAIGLLSGIVGAGGGFILIPVMLRVLKIPMRIAVGSSLGIVAIGALMGSVGKIVTGQVPWDLVGPVVLGSLPASLLGSSVSKRLSPKRVRLILVGLVLAILFKTWIDIARLLVA